jgi:hypothetical protein
MHPGTAMSASPADGEDASASTTAEASVDLAPASVGQRSTAWLVNVGLFLATLGVGWLVWSVVEWCGGRNPSYRLRGLRVLRRVDGSPAGLGRSVLRELCCVMLMVPTLIACAVIGLGFAMGASPPEGVFGQSRRAPWDVLTRSVVVRAEVGEIPGAS